MFFILKNLIKKKEEVKSSKCKKMHQLSALWCLDFIFWVYITKTVFRLRFRTCCGVWKITVYHLACSIIIYWIITPVLWYVSYSQILVDTQPYTDFHLKHSDVCKEAHWYLFWRPHNTQLQQINSVFSILFKGNRKQMLQKNPNSI